MDSASQSGYTCGMAPLRDPVAVACSAAGIEQRRRACAPSSPVRVGLLVNASAGQLKASGQRSALQAVVAAQPAGSCFVEATPDLASVRRALAHLLAVQGCNVLAVAGGDGTLHHAVNTLAGLDADAHHQTGESPPWPRWLVLSGGTLNIVARTLGSHGEPAKRLQQFLTDFSGVRLSRLPARRVPLLAAGWQGRTPTLGFVFGSEVAFHAIALYARFGAGYSGLLRFLLEFSRGALVGSDLWQQEGWKLGPYTGPLAVDGEQIGPYTGIVAATVDLTLAVAAARTIRRQLLQPGMSVRLVQETEATRLITLLPAMMRDTPARGLRDWPSAQQMRLQGPFTLDGELYPLPSQAPAHTPLIVGMDERRLQAVPGEWARADEPGVL